jgi:hypothetical protein
MAPKMKINPIKTGFWGSCLFLFGSIVLFFTELFLKINIIGIYITLYCVFFYYILFKQTNCYFSVVAIFIEFFWIALVGRIFLSNIGLYTENLVQASKYDPFIARKANYYILLSINMIGIFYFLFSKNNKDIFYAFIIQKFTLNKKIKFIFFLIFFISGLILVKNSISTALVIRQRGYLDIIESGDFEGFNFWCYSLLKWSWIILFITLQDKNANKVTILFLIFLMALPLTGQRGYFIFYLLLSISFLESKQAIRFKLRYIVPLIMLILYSITSMLEYRLGFRVSEDGIFSPIILAITAQGGTYEVIYGAIEYIEKLNFFKDVIFHEYFGNPPFGVTIDFLRGVPFADGKFAGFGSSALAEIAPAGLFGWMLYIIFLAFILNVLNDIFLFLSKNIMAFFTLFYMLPVVWGQARGALIHLPSKILGLIVILLFSICIKQNKEHFSN